MKFYKLDIAISILSLTLFIGSLLLAFKSTKIVGENFNFTVASISGKKIEGLKTKEESHDFGLRKMSDGELKYSVPLKNFGGKAINILKVSTSCECARATLSKDKIVPGETVLLQVAITLSDYGPFGVGLISPSVILEDADGGIEKLRFSVLVIP